MIFSKIKLYVLGAALTMENENQPISKPKLKLKLPAFGTNLTKLQKVSFIALIVLVLILGTASVYFYNKWNSAKNENANAIAPAANIQQMNCDKAKVTLEQVNSDPDLIQVFTNVVIDSVNGSAVSFYTAENVFQSFMLTADTVIKKDTGNSFIDGDKNDLKKDVKISMLKANPMGEIEYVGYSN